MDSFITSLYCLAEHCGYGALHTEMIRDRIVVGLRDAALSEKLQLDAELTLDKAVASARQRESVRKQQAVVRAEDESQSVDTVHAKYMPKASAKHTPKPKAGVERPKRPPYQKHVSPTQSTKTCTRCGRSPPHGRQQCPAEMRRAISARRRDTFRSCVGHQGLWGQYRWSKETLS